MFMDNVHNHLPSDWSQEPITSYSDTGYKLVEISPASCKYNELKAMMRQFYSSDIQKIVRVQNPYLYGQFLLKTEEYKTRGDPFLQQLVHATAQSKIPSIVSGNLDWRLATRVKYGEGVSFSPSPVYAHQWSSPSNGFYRAMIVADVLIQNKKWVSSSLKLPPDGYDTTVGNNGLVYVKFYDNEFYPKYIIYYKQY